MFLIETGENGKPQNFQIKNRSLADKSHQNRNLFKKNNRQGKELL